MPKLKLTEPFHLHREGTSYAEVGPYVVVRECDITTSTSGYYVHRRPEGWSPGRDLGPRLAWADEEDLCGDVLYLPYGELPREPLMSKIRALLGMATQTAQNT